MSRASTELDEESPANSTNLYGITKLAGERVALRYGDLFGLDVIAVRPSNVYGPMERLTPGYAGATELREMLRIHFAGEPIKVASLAASYRDWTFAEDVAEGIERAWSVGGPCRTGSTSCSRGEQYSVGDVLEAFRANRARTGVQGRARDEANYPVELVSLRRRCR